MRKNIKERGVVKISYMVFILLFLVVIITTQSVLAGKHAYPDLIHDIGDEVAEILRKNGLPAKRDRNIPWIALAGSDNKYAIYLYQADEIPFEAKIETIQFLMELYENRGKNERFRVMMYRETKEERRAPYRAGKIFAAEPFFDMTLGGDN